MYDIIIIGSGPAGYVAAIRAGQTGLKTAIIEKESIGGMCLNWGCIPSKAMLESLKLYSRVIKEASRFGIDGIDPKQVSFNWNKAIKRSDGIVKKMTSGIEYLLKKSDVEIIKGEARIVSNNSINVDNRLLQTKTIIIAIGTHYKELKLQSNIEVIDPKELYKEREIPQNVVVVGNSPVTIEIAQALKIMGKEVAILSPNDVIMPKADNYIRDFMIQKLKKDRIKLYLNTDIESISKSYANGVFTVEDREVPCQLIINTSDRVANTILSDIDIEYKNGYISTDPNYMTSQKGVYAIGDVNGVSMYAHVASAQGLYVINKLNGIDQKLDLAKIPMNMYTIPEAAQIGYTQEQLNDMGQDFKVSEFPISANGKAQTEGNAEGFVRILSEKKYGEVLGVQIIAPNATDMINEASAYMQLESTIYDIAGTIHTHPTISEVFMEAGFEAVDRAIHK